MYSWIWKKLPGPNRVKVLEAVLTISVFVAVLYLFVFPAIDAFFQDPTLG